MARANRLEPYACLRLVFTELPLRLDRFFHRFAGQNQFRHYVGVTYVAVDEGKILGFATIAPGHIDVPGTPCHPRGTEGSRRLTRDSRRGA